MKLLVRGGRVIDPSQGLDAICDIMVEDGLITRSESSLEAEDADVVEASGLVVCPGLIDMHVHLREPGREDEETVETGSRAAVAGGFTAIACMPNTQPPTEGEEGVKFIQAKAREAALAHVYPIAAISKELKGKTLSEVGSALRVGAVGVSDDGMPVNDSGLMRRVLEYVKMFNRPVMVHCEDAALSSGGVMHEGMMSTRLGLKGIPGESEDAMVIRDILLTEMADSRLHVCHVSTARSMDFIGEAKARGARVTCEVTPHHFTLSDQAVETYDTDTKIKPPLRTQGDVAALRQAIKAGLVDAIASDHAPHSEEEKDQEFDVAPFGIIGLETSLGLACKILYHGGIVGLEDLVRMMSINPARILGIQAGTLATGAPANITLFDPDAEWEVDPAGFRSKSRNTPFSGWKLKGRAITVIVDGRILMRDGELIEGDRTA